MVLIWAVCALVGAWQYWDNFWVGLLSFAVVGAIAYSGNRSSILNTINKGGK